MTEQQKLAQYGPIVARFESKSNPGKQNEVRAKDGKLSCNCTGWRFKRTCRHVEYLAKEVAAKVAPKVSPKPEQHEPSLEAAIQAAVDECVVLSGPRRRALVLAITRKLNDLVRDRLKTVKAPEAAPKKARLIILDD